MAAEPVGSFASVSESVRFQAQADVVASLRSQHALRQRLAKADLAQTQKTQREALTVRHEAVADPEAYDRMEALVLKAKESEEARKQEVRRVAQHRASLRKGGLNEIQELVTELPPSSGPIGRIYRPSIFGKRTLVEDLPEAI